VELFFGERMNIGILKEDPHRERRIALTPAAVQVLIHAGNTVYVEKDAGNASHFTNEEFQAVGAQIVYTRDEVFGRSEMLLKILSPTEEECELLIDSQILFSFLHLAVARKKIVEALLRKRICSIGYELIEDGNANLPILQEMSEIAGLMSIHVGARYLESSSNGRGVVLGGITGIPPALVVIVGAGTAGQAAARAALGIGAKVIVFDKDLSRLRIVGERFNRRVDTMITTQYNLTKALKNADVLIGAVLIKGERTPHVVTEEMVRQMKAGAIVIDVSIDQGGCVETSRPTTLESPTYTVHNILHYCVPNMAANVARTATYGLTNGLLPYITTIAGKGIQNAIKESAGLQEGICTYKGFCTKEAVARRFELDPSDVHTLSEG
jgi:alanine dehydrogenase